MSARRLGAPLAARVRTSVASADGRKECPICGRVPGSMLGIVTAASASRMVIVDAIPCRHVGASWRAGTACCKLYGAAGRCRGGGAGTL